jgi:glycosyltransferase involved in cell wall biosynthesis
VICTRGLRASLARCLDSLLNQDCRRSEIVLVLNGDPDEALFRALARYPIRVLNEPRRGVCVARNHAIPRTRGEILAFVDDDISASPEWLHELLKGFEDPAVGCVTGRVIPEGPCLFSAERAQRYYASERALSYWDLDPSDPDCYQKAFEGPAGFGCNMAFRRAFLENCTLFPEDLGAGSVIGGGDEFYMFVQVLKHAFRLRHTPSAIVTHFFERSEDSRRLRTRQLYAGAVAFALKLLVEEKQLRFSIMKWLMRAMLKRVSRVLRNKGALSDPSELLSPREKIQAYLRGPWLLWKSHQARLGQHLNP